MPDVDVQLIRRACSALPAPAPDQAPPGNSPTPQTISMYAIAGVRSSDAMLLSVDLCGQRVVALLNSGSSANFVSADLMRRLLPHATPHPTLRVLVANGDHVPCQGVARDVPMWIGSEDFSISSYGIGLGASDLIILGFQFLRSLGKVLWDLEAPSMTFLRDGRQVLWTGLTLVAAPSASLQPPHSSAAEVGPRRRLPLLLPTAAEGQARGVAMEGDKVAAMSTWPTPRSARGLWDFLGLMGYY